MQGVPEERAREHIGEDTAEILVRIAESALDSDAFRSLDDTLDKICLYVYSSLRCADVEIRVLDPDKEELVARGRIRIPEAALYGRNDPLFLSDPPVSYLRSGLRAPSIEVFLRARPFTARVGEFDTSSDRYSSMRECGIGAMYFAPIVRNGTTVGVLACYWRDEQLPDRGDRSLVATMCRLAAVAITTATIADEAARIRSELEDVYRHLEHDNKGLQVVQSAQSAMIRLLADRSARTIQQTATSLASAIGRSVMVCRADGVELAVQAAEEHLPALRAALSRRRTDGGDCTVIRMEGGRSPAAQGSLIITPALSPRDEYGQIIAAQAALVMGGHLQAQEMDSALSTFALPAVLLTLCHGLAGDPQIQETYGLLNITETTALYLAVARTPTPEAAFRLGRKHETLRSAGWRWLAACADGCDVLLLLHGDEPDRASARHFMAMSPQAARMGLSSPFIGLDQLPQALKQARAAASVAATDRGVAYHGDFGSFGNVAAALEPEQITDFVTATLGELRRYDARRGTGLVDTLRRYVAHSGQIAETATELSIHVNTLHQRIQRIEQVTGLDLHSYRDIARVTLALDMLRLAGDTSLS
ncbi:helix-turn-helix domain-containing protein [Nocardia aurantia]|uniref:GAF domain-containing protein n=1 Tax=Nocardia aurantia TaxID=2585199 RepID=A0A7K0DK04_9NOCA|nr:helix-turn-helix domain-containing protein [Nocardia aurantia]MQY26145.1 hypothetical protein [Nocardia aurantia]